MIPDHELRARATEADIRRVGAWRVFAEAVLDAGIPLDASVMTSEQAEAFCALADEMLPNRGSDS